MEHEEVREELLRGRVLSIEMGTRLQLQVGGRGTELKLNGTLIGMSPQEFLIVDIPAIPGVLAKLTEGSRITIRYMFAGGVYGFTTSVLSCIHKPKLILFLSYPRALEVINLRKAKRLISLMPASVEINHKTFSGMVMDLSEGGCRLSIESEEGNLPVINSGDEVFITLQLTGVAGTHVVHGMVQTVRHGGRIAEMGIKFDEDDAESTNRINEYLKSISKLQEHVPSINRCVG